MLYPNPLYESEHLREVTGLALRPGGLELTRKGLSLCAFAPGARLLDAGCGAGSTLALLGQLGFCALGVDSSVSLLQEAAANGPAVLADIASLPLASCSFNGVLCECALSLQQDKFKVLGEFHRVLGQGGKLMLSDLCLRDAAPPTPAQGPFFSCLQGALAANELKAMLERCGFKLKHFSDESYYLRELAARMIFQFGSPAAFWQLWGGAEEGGCSCAEAAKNMGYCLVVAEKV